MLYTTRRIILAQSLIVLLQLYAFWARIWPSKSSAALDQQSSHSPEDLDPTIRGHIENPYDYYRWLRDERPVFKPKGQDFYCISRYADIQSVAKQTEAYSSNIVNVLMEKMLGPAMMPKPKHAPGEGSRKNYGVSPVDVLAIQDLPAHRYQKLLTHQILSADFVRNLIPDVEALSQQLIDQFIDRPEVEFMDAAAWKLPMLMAMRLLGCPESDYPLVKDYCSHVIRLLAGTTTKAEFLQDSVAGMQLYQYCWRCYEAADQLPEDNLTASLRRAAEDPQHPLSPEEAVSIILQILIAGSDSSASTMGNAVRLLIENPQLQDQLRDDPSLIDSFVEEVLRLESAFQGHFRLVTEDSELHGVTLPKGTRLFLLWASGNRDERFWGEHADRIDLQRKNLRRHLTFGFGLHACLGRELARMEIRIMLRQLLQRTRNIRLAEPVEHVASLFTRTLLRLPIRFDTQQATNDARQSDASSHSQCPHQTAADAH